MWAILAVLVIFFVVLLPWAGFNIPALLVMALVLFVLVSFSSLRVIIDQSHVRLQFGYGVIKKAFAVQDINLVRTVKNHWYYGWGVRMWAWPRMIIFNVSGFDAVELTMKNGRIYRIGTDEPQQLEYAIRAARGE